MIISFKMSPDAMSEHSIAGNITQRPQYFHLAFKGIVQPFKTGVMGGIIRLAFELSTFPQFSNFFLKDPGPLNRKKRNRGVKQLSLGQVTIMWRPLQNAL
jgi:hypothetical protein